MQANIKDIVQSEVMALSEITPNKGQIPGVPKNPRFIRDEKFNSLKKSIQDDPEMLGLREILVFPYEGKNIIIGGNMRFRALKDLGYTEAIVKILPSDMSAEKLRALAIKDNNGYGEWDWGAINLEWDTSELENWGIDIPEIETEPTKVEAKEDDFSEKDQYEQRVEKGDVWKLGKHRLMCGDSTIPADVARLMDGEKADLCFTSPPYNVGDNYDVKVLGGGKYERNSCYGEYQDQLNDDAYATMLNHALTNALEHADDVIFNIGGTSGALKGTAKMIGDNARYFAGIIAWKKKSAFNPVFPSQLGVLRNIVEPMYFFNKRNARNFEHPQWTTADLEDNYFECENASGNEFSQEHKATFPITLPAHYIERCTEKSVLDLFGGTGTTLIAAEQLGRKCFMMELDAHYCDIILARWEKQTGQKAVRVVC